MTEEDSTIHMGIIIAAESFAFDLEEDAETGDGSGLTTTPSASCFGIPLMNWAWPTRSIGRPPFSKNFSVAIRGGGVCWRGKENKGVKRKKGNGLTVGGMRNHVGARLGDDIRQDPWNHPLWHTAEFLSPPGFSQRHQCDVQSPRLH